MGSKDMKSPFSKVMKQKYRLRGKIKTRGMVAMMDVKDINTHVHEIMKQKNLNKPKIKENIQEVINLNGVKSPIRQESICSKAIKLPVNGMKSPFRDIKSPVRETKTPGNKVMKQKYRLRGKIKTRGMMALMDVRDVKSHVNQILKQKNLNRPKVIGSKERKSIDQEVIGLKDTKSHVKQEVIPLKDMKSHIKREVIVSRDIKSPVREIKSPSNKVLKQNYRLRGKIKTRGMMALMDVKDVKTHVNQILKQKNIFKNKNNHLKIAKELRLKECNPGYIRALIDEVVEQKNDLKNEKELEILENNQGVNGLKVIKPRHVLKKEKELNVKERPKLKMNGKNMKSQVEVDMQKDDLKKEKEESTLEVMVVKDKISQVEDKMIEENEKELKIKECFLPVMDVKESKSEIQQVHELKNEKELELDESIPGVMDVKDTKIQIEAVQDQKDEKELEMEESAHVVTRTNTRPKSQVNGVKLQKGDLKNGKHFEVEENMDKMSGEKDSNSNIEKVYEKKSYLENEEFKIIEGTLGRIIVRDNKSPNEVVTEPQDILKNEKEQKLKECAQEVIGVIDINSQIESVNEHTNYLENEKELKLNDSTQDIMEHKSILSLTEKVNDQKNVLETEKEQNTIEIPQINGVDNPSENGNEIKLWVTPKVNGLNKDLENKEQKIIGSPHGLMGLKDIKLHLNKLVKQKSLLKKRRCLFKLDSSEIFDSAPPDETDHSIYNSIDNPHVKGKKRKIEETFNPHIKQRYSKKKEEIANPFIEIKCAEKIEEEYFQEMQSKMKSQHKSPGKIKSFKNSLKSRRCLFKYNVGDMYEGPPNEIIPLEYKLTESPHKIVQRQIENKTNLNTKDL